METAAQGRGQFLTTFVSDQGQVGKACPRPLTTADQVSEACPIVVKTLEDAGGLRRSGSRCRRPRLGPVRIDRGRGCPQRAVRAGKRLLAGRRRAGLLPEAEAIRVRDLGPPPRGRSRRFAGTPAR